MWTLCVHTALVLLGTATSYRLPSSVVPAEYRLEIVTNLGEEGKFDFEGKAWINIRCKENTNNITLHSKNLKIDIHHSTLKHLREKEWKSEPKIKTISQIKADDFLVVDLEEELLADNTYELYVPFSGKIEEGLAGYYRSSYLDKETNKTKWLAVTQFEPSDARRAFPCFDEPAFKAKFEISLGRSKKFSSISNMPIVKTEKMENREDYEWDRYQTSVPMSTYLVAYAVSDFHHVTSPKTPDNSNITFKIWARKDALDQVDFAKEIGPKFLSFYEKYFDIRYPLPKQDMIAVPDFSAGAMENWGLITYRETYLLFEPKVSSILSKLSVASVVAHELAHQWFGNLVTMKWWTDLWLNEGFATYMAAIAVSKLMPEWNSLKEETIDNLLAVLSFDSLQSSHPVSVPIGNPKEIAEIFDTISYKKGSYLLHMMSNFLGEEVLRTGVSKYLKAHKYGNAEQDDLWKAITEEAHGANAIPKELTVKEIMDTWTLQTGYPVLNVTREKNGSVLMIQERFLKERDPQKTHDSSKPKWWVPITHGTEKDVNSQSKSKIWLSPNEGIKSIEINAKPEEWFIFNVNATGLYRVNYDQKNWDDLIATVQSDHYKSIPILNRVLLIDDSANLAWVGRLHYKNFFEIVSYLEKEIEYLPWKVALRSIASLDILLKRTSTYGHFTDYIRKIIRPIYNKIGGFQNIPEHDNNVDALQHRALITSTACKFDHPKCTEEAISLFKKLQENPLEKDNIPKDLRGVVYCNGVKYGGEKEWTFLWNLYLNSNVAAEKNLILRNLGCTRQAWLLERYLEWALEPNSGIRKQDITTVFSTVASTDLGFHVTRTFVQENIKMIHERIQPTINKLTSILANLAAYMTRNSEYLWLQRFTDENMEYFKEIKNGVKQSIETAKLNSQWCRENLKEIKDLLKKY